MSGVGPGWETVPFQHEQPFQRCGGAGQIWDAVRDVMVGPDRGRTKSTAAAHLYELIGEVGRIERELNQAELREAHLRNGVRELLDICRENLEIMDAALNVVGKLAALDSQHDVHGEWYSAEAVRRLIKAAGAARKLSSETIMAHCKRVTEASERLLGAAEEVTGR